MPKISVIMPAFNAEKYIAEAIDSILAQTFADFELIIINDCSADRTEEIILSYQDSRIVYLKNAQNMGVAKTLNRGLSVARGEYITRMDADDISLPERFEKQVHYMQSQPETVVCGSYIQLFNEEGDLSIKQYPCEDKQIKTALLFCSAFAHPAVMMRANAIKIIGYDPSFEKVEDYRLWTQLAEMGAFHNISTPLLRYRKHDQQVCATSSQAQYEGKCRIASLQLPKVGICEGDDIRILTDAFDNRLKECERFRRFEKLAVCLCRKTLEHLDKKQLSTILKSRLIEVAQAEKFTLSFKSLRVVGMKAWIYVQMKNLGEKR